MILNLSIPTQAILKVDIGQTVQIGKPLYEIATTYDVSIPIATTLNISGEEMFAHITKVIGDPVKKGDVVAQKKGFLSSKKIYAQHDGVVGGINHTTGTITIATDKDGGTSQKQIVASFFNGIIESIDSTGHQLVVKIEKGIEFPLKNVDVDGGGALYYFADESHYFTATEEEIEGRVIIIEELKPHIVAKCEALDATGFVCIKNFSPQAEHVVQLAKIDDFKSLASSKKTFILYSTLEKKAIAYDS